jgi:hypothetical protein
MGAHIAVKVFLCSHLRKVLEIILVSRRNLQIVQECAHYNVYEFSQKSPKWEPTYSGERFPVFTPLQSAVNYFSIAKELTNCAGMHV